MEKTGMSIEYIDEEKCIGCGNCVDTCPVDVIRIDPETEKAVICYPQDCVCCAACLYDCPTDAIMIDPAHPCEPMRAW